MKNLNRPEGSKQYTEEEIKDLSREALIREGDFIRQPLEDYSLLLYSGLVSINYVNAVSFLLFLVLLLSYVSIKQSISQVTVQALVDKQARSVPPIKYQVKHLASQSTITCE